MAGIELQQNLKNQHLPLRPSELVMQLDRLGCLYQYRLSFMRVLLRRMAREQWQIERPVFELDEAGFGHAIYEIRAGDCLYSFVVFAHYLDPDKRSDRVIANQWDMTVTLRLGTVSNTDLERLRENVPLQEAGRLDSQSIVLSRANKSTRNFDYVIDCLARGEQPSLDAIAEVGYLYRTTAVYGSGKFGMADWQKVCSDCSDFSHPFSAEMLTCYLIRQFSLEQADYVAGARAPSTAVALDRGIKRYMGIGNATGLGMAPYLINHPLLISRWIEIRETALARVVNQTQCQPETRAQLLTLMTKAARHLGEICTGNEQQTQINETAREEILACANWLNERGENFKDWSELLAYTSEHYAVETQELLNSLLTEVHPEVVDDLESEFSLTEHYKLNPAMPAAQLRALIEQRYQWALTTDESEDSEAVFWYRSEEKMEPRLGERGFEPGARREIAIDVGRAVARCHADLQAALKDDGTMSVAGFCLRSPQHRRIIRRIQTMAATHYGDIQANLLDREVLPIHLLRCKLSFFGVGKFDPKSRLWVRNTMFQGAPLRDEIDPVSAEDWCFPVKPGASANP